MPGKINPVAVLKRIHEQYRQEGLVSTLLKYMKVAGIQISPFYYLKEDLLSNIPGKFAALPDGFDFSAFDKNDVLAISNLTEREGYADPEYVLDNFERGEICFGLKYKGEIAAFSWVSLDECRTNLYPVRMKQNEAYLHDMYVLKAFRGRNLAPILRNKTYGELRDMGRETFFSVTEFFNRASLRFKLKLDAEIVFLALYVGLFNGKYQKRWMLKRY